MSKPAGLGHWCPGLHGVLHVVEVVSVIVSPRHQFVYRNIQGFKIIAKLINEIRIETGDDVLERLNNLLVRLLADLCGEIIKAGRLLGDCFILRGEFAAYLAQSLGYAGCELRKAHRWARVLVGHTSVFAYW